MMTDRARSLGMKSTTFMTPNGLPDPEQITTARDMAKLASAVLRTHPEQYKWFGQRTFRFRGATYKNTNGLLHSLTGVDGFKTGFTNASGYNLIISAERPDTSGADRRLIAVVLGGASGKSRNAHMADLIEQSFEQMGVAPAPKVARVVTIEDVPTPAPITQALSLRRSDGGKTRIAQGQTVTSLAKIGKPGWAIRVGRFESVPDARDQLGALFGMDTALGKSNAVIQPTARGFEARFTGLSFDQATDSCARLSGLASGCSLIAPSRSE
jgi:D-alanyl-D-alanine carboxypeptidase